MKKKKYIIYLLFFSIIFNNKSFNIIEKEMKKHFNEMMDIINESENNIKEESNFPSNTEIKRSRIEIDTEDEELCIISMELPDIIHPENITTSKNNNNIIINIKFENSLHEIIIKENEILISSETNQKIKNKENTKYTQSSSQMRRQEKINKCIDLNSIKIKVDSQDKSIQIITKYIHSKKNNIDIEFK